MRGILTGDMTAPAANALLLIDPCLGDVIEIEMLPVHHIGHRHADKIFKTGKALLVHPFAKPGNHLLDNAKPIGHHRCADLNICRAQRHEFGGITPAFHPANTRDGTTTGFRVAGNFGHHVKGNGLDRRAAIATM